MSRVVIHDLNNFCVHIIGRNDNALETLKTLVLVFSSNLFPQSCGVFVENQNDLRIYESS